MARPETDSCYRDEFGGSVRSVRTHCAGENFGHFGRILATAYHGGNDPVKTAAFIVKPLEVYHQAFAFGLRLEPSGDRLLVFGEHCPQEFAEVLREHKGELMDWLNRPPCPGFGAVPPDDFPLNPVMPRPTPQDRERVIGFLLRQCCDRSEPLTAWLVRRESAYYDGPGRHWDCASHAYAAARDAACWQLNRGEAEVRELLAEFEETGRRSE